MESYANKVLPKYIRTDETDSLNGGQNIKH